MDDYRKYRSGGNAAPAPSYGQSSRYDDNRSNVSSPPAYSSSSNAASSTAYSNSSGNSRARFNPFEDGKGGAGGSNGPSYASKGQRFDEPDQRNDDEDDVEGIKRHISSVRQDTLASTRNAVAKVQETEAMAANTLTTLGRQGEQIINVERQLDMADLHADRAAEKTDELKRLNRSIFRPNFKNPFTSKKRAEKELEQKQREHEEYMRKKADLHSADYQTQQRVNAALGTAPGSGRQQQQYQSAKDKYGDETDRYAFEADEQDLQAEREIGQNLNILSDSMNRLKMMGTAMRDELDTQNERLGVVDTKTTTTHAKINLQSNRLDRIK